ncbi:PTS sugar transporter subunit IIA [Lactobacillus sp. ESL0785]|uniref:PTS sugar transporter subunit IIA n=1 Tax=Lactobacillus sp. ESL0785 TaxID=2983232 RepID=UPI0023F7B79A|nr:PTS sugar transporter subunit IIA [Lactobacillus sp. ESL0785]WEV71184.1 PTS sugar transporter subunit IIA [Lactobacillus sp. ESL0785]
MAEKELILISHGTMATGLKDSAELIMGEQEHVHSVCLLPDESPDDFKKKFTEAIAGMNISDITVFADLMGGTPANVVSQMIMGGQKLQLISGMNLPLVIEWLNSQMNGNDSDYITAGKAGMVNITEMLANMKK